MKNIIIGSGCLSSLFWVVGLSITTSSFPDPDEAKLKSCLAEAKALPDNDDAAVARNTCFRTYSHFL